MTDQKSRTDEPRPSKRLSLYSGPRGTAVKILNRVDRTDSYLDKLLDAELRSPDLNDLDKGLLTEIAHGVLRWQSRLDWVLNGFSHGNFAKSEINIKNALRVALYQILFLGRVPHSAAVNEAVEFVKRIRGEKPAGLVNAVLRNIIRNMDGIRYPDRKADEIQYLSVFFAHPQWMVKRWVSRFGVEEATRLFQANNERPSLSLRINTLKIEPVSFLRQLEQQKITYTGSSHIDYFVKVKRLTRIGQMELFRNGMFTIQDESAALPGILLAPRPGDRVVDLCAAPGGKTTHIAELMKNDGEIVALDKYEAKLNLIRASCDRLGCTIVSLRVGDAMQYEQESVDKVLLDVPCSGLGVLAKKPDIKWKRDVSDIYRLREFQLQFIESAARLLKAGGVLVYCTCTTEPEENQGIVQEFLRTHPDFSLDHAGQYVSKDLVSEDGYIETFPHRHEMDGSFAARLIRKGS
ncbi:MAG: 16S rRNA (cytosine(967)-C(5))-methyltransferase RsmB [Bacteroidota bacterium]